MTCKNNFTISKLSLFYPFNTLRALVLMCNLDFGCPVGLSMLVVRPTGKVDSAATWIDLTIES